MSNAFPTGTVTMLFTDIEGSTRLLKQLGERYGELLSDHRRLLREAVAAHGGREMDTQGDAFFFAFARARNAVEAAVDAQRTLAAHTWPDGVECRVRMGLHTGEPSVLDEGYHGIGLHRGARIAGAAHGGQILLSSSTAELIQDDLPPGVALRDLGVRRLKDIDRPEHVYQAVAEGLTSAFPPPRTAEAPRRTRRPAAIGAAAAVVAAAVAAAVIVGTRGGGGHATAAAISTDSVGILSAANGRVTGQVGVGSSPSAVTTGADSVWVANVDDHSVSRIDPAKQSVVDTIQVGNGPSGIAFGHGFIWVTNGADGSVSQIDPQTNTVVQTIPNVGNGPDGIAVAGRSVWVASSGDGAVTRIDAVAGTTRDVASVGQGAAGVAVGAGSVWVTNEATGVVTRIDEHSGGVLQPIRAGSGTSAVAVAAGSVWVTNSLDSTVTRIDAASNSVRATIAVGDAPSGIVVTRGAVCVSDELAGTLTRIDPVRNVRAQTVPTGNRPEGLAVAAGGLFVAVRASGAGHRGGTLTVLAEKTALLSIDPAIAYGPQDNQIVTVTHDGLTTVRKVGGSDGNRLVPDLAVSLPSPTDGGRSWTFTLRPGIRYSTGAVVRPQDVRRGIERSLVQGYQGNYFSHIVGAPKCLAAPKKPCDLSGGIVADPTTNTVTFRLSSPDPDFLYKLSIAAADAVPARTPTHARGPVPGTGPYMVASSIPSHVVRLVRNPHFREWSPAAQPSGFPDEIVMRLGGTEDGRVAAVEQGAADLTTGGARPSAAVLSRLRTQHASQLKITPGGFTYGLALNTTIAPFDDLRARRAFELAVDRQRLSDLSFGQGLGQVTCQILPPDFAGYRRYCPYTLEPAASGAWTGPDLARARSLARTSGAVGQQVTVWMPGWVQLPAAPGRYAVSVLDALGYKARLRFAPQPYDHEDEMHVQAGFFAWYADYATPAGFFANTLSCASNVPDNGLNVAKFCNRAIDEEIARAQGLQITDPESAARLWAKVDREVTDQAPWVSYSNPLAVEVVSKRVGNYQYNPELQTLLDQLWVR